jgi:hypothetical protein
MLKHWILGNPEKAAQESEIMWDAHRYDIARVAPKALVAKWLEGDWKSREPGACPPLRVLRALRVSIAPFDVLPDPRECSHGAHRVHGRGRGNARDDSRQDAKAGERSRLERWNGGESEFAREGAKPRRIERDAPDCLSSFASWRLERSGREVQGSCDRWERVTHGSRALSPSRSPWCFDLPPQSDPLTGCNPSGVDLLFPPSTPGATPGANRLHPSGMTVGPRPHPSGHPSSFRHSVIRPSVRALRDAGGATLARSDPRPASMAGRGQTGQDRAVARRRRNSAPSSQLSSRVQAALALDDFTTASMKAIPRTPSSILG